MPERAPRIVAELGRPETPAERAERRERDSRLRRERQTVANLVWALAASLGLVLIVVWAVPRPDSPLPRSIDAAGAAANASAALGVPALVPDLTGSLNAAELRRSPDGTVSWNIAYTIEKDHFLALAQATHPTTGWLADLLAKTSPVATRQLGGLRWQVYDNRARGREVGNAQYALVTVHSGHAGAAGQTVVIYGDASEEQFITVATAIARDLGTITPTASGG